MQKTVSTLTESYQDQEQHLLAAITHAPLALCKWWVDGTLVFATDEGFRRLGIDISTALSRHYRALFDHVPEVVRAIEQAFAGHTVSETIRVNNIPWDVRFVPAYDSRKNIAGVVGILTDASDRITSFRLFHTLDVLSLIRKHLAQTDSTEEFLHNVCDVIQQLYAAVWVGLAERSEGKAFKIITANEAANGYFDNSALSWDVSQKTGRNAAAEAFRTGRTKVATDIANSPECELWHAGARMFGWKALLAIPLLREGASLGVLVIHNSDAEAFDSEEISLWEKIAAEITEGIWLLDERAARKRIALERQEVDDNYKRLIETVFDVIVVHCDGKILDINPAGVRLAGARTSEQLVGTPLIALIEPQDRDRVQKSFARKNAAQAMEMMEFKLLGLDSSLTDVEGVTVPIRHHGAPAQLSVLRDISQRKLNEQAISKAKASLEYAQQIAKMGSIELDILSGRTEWSKNALAILELGEHTNPNEFINTISRRLVGEEDRLAVQQLIDDIRKNAKASSTELRILGSHDADKTIQIHGIPEVTQHVFVPRIFFVVQDITEFREIERGLKVTTERLLRAQEIGHTGDFEILAEYDRITLSERACGILGLAVAQSMLSLDGFYRQIHHDDQANIKSRFGAMLANDPPPSVMANNRGDTSSPQGLCIDCRLASPQNEQWINIQGLLVDNGKERKIIGNIQDITERKTVELAIKRSEEKLAQAQRVARVWEWHWDVEHDVVTWSETLNTVLGFESPVTQLTFEQLMNSIRDIDREPFRQAAKNTLTHGVTGEIEYIQKLLSGVSVRVLSRWEAVRDSSGEVTKIIGTSQDVTTLREAQERVARKERIHHRTGLPNKEMAYDRIYYLTEQAKRFDKRFAAVGLKVNGYRSLKERMGDKDFYHAQLEIAKNTNHDLAHLDTFARLDKGRFLLIFDQPLSSADVASVTQYVHNSWSNAFAAKNGASGDLVSVDTCSVHCPEDGTDWEGLLKLVAHRLEQP